MRQTAKASIPVAPCIDERIVVVPIEVTVKVTVVHVHGTLIHQDSTLNCVSSEGMMFDQ